MAIVNSRVHNRQRSRPQPISDAGFLKKLKLSAGDCDRVAHIKEFELGFEQNPSRSLLLSHLAT